MRLTLGTAQFGMKYGITNIDDKPTKNEIKKILEIAKYNGIINIDTAINYGSSELSLGKIGLDTFNVITKIPAFIKNESEKTVELFIKNSVFRSLKNLNKEFIDGILLHSPQDLKEEFGQRIWKSLIDCKKNGLVKNIGYSIYNPNDLEFLFNNFFPDIVQTPFNIFDTRIRDTGWLEKLNINNVQVFARSVFLQGLLLLDTNKLPRNFKKWSSYWIRWNKWLQQNHLTSKEACLNFNLNEKLLTSTIVGVQTSDQLKELLCLDLNKKIVDPNFKINNENIIDPRFWT